MVWDNDSQIYLRLKLQRFALAAQRFVFTVFLAESAIWVIETFARAVKTIFFRRLPERGTREKKPRLMKSKQTNGPHPPGVGWFLNS